MTGSSSNFDFKIDDVSWQAQKRESWSPPWRPCRGLRDTNSFQLDRAQNIDQETFVAQPYSDSYLKN